MHYSTLLSLLRLRPQHCLQERSHGLYLGLCRLFLSAVAGSDRLGQNPGEAPWNPRPRSHGLGLTTESLVRTVFVSCLL